MGCRNLHGTDDMQARLRIRARGRSDVIMDSDETALAPCFVLNDYFPTNGLSLSDACLKKRNETTPPVAVNAKIVC
jgi:hypothetical protein